MKPAPTDLDPQFPYLNRRRVLQALVGLGVGTGVFRRALAAQAENEGVITAEMIKQAEWVAGLELTEEQREATAHAMNGLRHKFEAMRATPVSYETPPALMFHAAPPQEFSSSPPERRARLIEDAAKLPASKEDLAFLPVSELSALVRSRQVSSVELTKLYLKRLQRFDPKLHCVVTLTEDVALAQVAETFGTPVFVYSRASLERAVSRSTTSAAMARGR